MEKVYIGNVCCLIPLYVFAYVTYKQHWLDCYGTSNVFSQGHPSSRVSDPCLAHSKDGKGGGGSTVVINQCASGVR